jgi:hypothetical protein
VGLKSVCYLKLLENEKTKEIFIITCGVSILKILYSKIHLSITIYIK